MEIRGREVRFLRTVQAECNIAIICEDGKSENFQKLLMGNDYEVMVNMAEVMHFLSEGYENAKHFEDSEYEPQPLTAEELMFLPVEDFNKLWEEAVIAYYGEKQTVKVAKSKSKKKTKETSD